VSRIVVACKNNTDYTNVINALNKNDYSVFARATTSFELQNFVKLNEPDAVVIYGKLGNSVSFIDSIIDFHFCPVIVIDSEYQKTNYYNYLANSRFQFIEEIGFTNSINIVLELIIRVGREFKDLNQKLDQLESKSKTDKLVTRAKFYLVETKGISENEAHKMINSLSMKHRLPKASIAKKILEQKK
jgi:response regulator NasT